MDSEVQERLGHEKQESMQIYRNDPPPSFGSFILRSSLVGFLAHTRLLEVIRIEQVSEYHRTLTYNYNHGYSSL